jgi:PAS domain S-box-containing protein
VSVRTDSLIPAYGIAALAFLIALLAGLGIEPWLGRTVPYLVFFPAIMLAARYGGLGPGLFVTALSCLTVVVRYFDSTSGIALIQSPNGLSLVLFATVGALIASLSDTVRRAEGDRWHLAAIVESSEDAIVGTDLNGVIKSWNRGAERLFGYRAAEAIGRSITLIISPDRREEEEQVLRRIRAGQPAEPFESIRRRKDGTDVEVSITVSAITDGAGKITGASKIARDITDRRRTERIRAELVERQRLASREAEAARDRLAFLSEVGAAISSSLDYEETLDRAVHLALPRLGDYCNVLVIDEDGRMRHVAWGHVSREKEPMLNELVRLMIESSAAAGVPTFPDQVIQSGRTIAISNEQMRVRWTQVAPGGTSEMVALGEQLRPYAYVGVPLFVRGRGVGVISFGMTEQDSRREYVDADIVMIEEFARRVSVAIENARLFQQADELNRVKDEFLATLSHELRTPLSAVLGWSRMLAGGQLDPLRSKQAIDAIERNAQAQARIVDDILDVARATAGTVRLDLKPFDVVSIVQPAVEVVAPAALAKQIRIEVRAPVPVLIVGDPSRLQQVVWNLMSNALKFTPTGGHVTIEVCTAGDHAELRVTDTGIGIPAAFLPYVFDKFRQADGSFTRQHGGLGLGLAIARHLVELHGGSIAARSAGEGTGATFVVRLPLPAHAA